MRRLGALLGCIFTSAVCADAVHSAETAGPPDFSPSADVGWIAYGGTFMALPDGPRPVENEPSRPHIGGIIPDPYVPEPPDFLNGTTRLIADLDNPILRPWAREEVRKFKDVVLSGKPAYGRQVSCWPMGVPGFLLYGVQPVFFVQSPREVIMVWQTDHQVRRVYLDRDHSANPKPSWFGSSVGHYEGDTLIVDTVGMNDKTYVDNYRTPHTVKLHVVERFRLIDGGRTLEAKVHVEDEDTFTSPWEAIQLYRRVEPGPLIEASCAENNVNPFHQETEPLPEAAKPDF